LGDFWTILVVSQVKTIWQNTVNGAEVEAVAPDLVCVGVVGVTMEENSITS
jgi:hypothetical protein